MQLLFISVISILVTAALTSAATNTQVGPHIANILPRNRKAALKEGMGRKRGIADFTDGINAANRAKAGPQIRSFVTNALNPMPSSSISTGSVSTGFSPTFPKGHDVNLAIDPHFVKGRKTGYWQAKEHYKRLHPNQNLNPSSFPVIDDITTLADTGAVDFITPTVVSSLCTATLGFIMKNFGF